MTQVVDVQVEDLNVKKMLKEAENRRREQIQKILNDRHAKSKKKETKESKMTVEEERTEQAKTQALVVESTRVVYLISR